MKLNELKYTEGSRHSKKRVGRGIGSGMGKTSTRGQKGQNARTGGGVRPGFEGGQTPIFRRIPKFGFTNINTKKYEIFNLKYLENLGLSFINHEVLYEKKLISDKKQRVKVLANGTITKSITIKVNKFSKSAKDAIEKAGGKAEVI